MHFSRQRFRRYFASSKRVSKPFLTLACVLLVAACASAPPKGASGRDQSGSARPVSQAGANPHWKVGAPYRINGRTYRPAIDKRYDREGLASWYGDQFHGRHTANGEIFDKTLLSAAHKTLPLPIIAEVQNLENGRTIRVRVNDRGPFVDDRIIDLSEAAAHELGFRHKGLARVRVRYIADADVYALAAAPGRNTGDDGSRRAAVETIPQAIPQAIPQPIPPAIPQTFPQQQTDGLRYAQAPSIAPRARSEAKPDAPRIVPDAPRLAATRLAATRLPATRLEAGRDAAGHARAVDDDIAATIGADIQAGRPDQYWVEIAAFRDLAKLDTLDPGIGQLGSVAVVTDHADGAAPLHSVRVGPYAHAGDASRAKAQAVAAGFSDAVILLAR